MITRAHVLTGNWQRALRRGAAPSATACGDAHLKTILGTGDLGTLAQRGPGQRWSCMMAGADFIKTVHRQGAGERDPAGRAGDGARRSASTASGPATSSGFKPAGGIRTAKQSLDWLAHDEGGAGRPLAAPDLFRFGASVACSPTSSASSSIAATGRLRSAAYQPAHARGGHLTSVPVMTSVETSSSRWRGARPPRRRAPRRCLARRHASARSGTSSTAAGPSPLGRRFSSHQSGHRRRAGGGGAGHASADVDAAVAAARAALPGWQRARRPRPRARHLYAIARHDPEALRGCFAVLESLDNGKPIRESRDIDVPLVARHFYHHAGWAQLMRSRVAGLRAASAWSARSSRGTSRC